MDKLLQFTLRKIQTGCTMYLYTPKHNKLNCHNIFPLAAVEWKEKSANVGKGNANPPSSFQEDENSFKIQPWLFVNVNRLENHNYFFTTQSVLSECTHAQIGHHCFSLMLARVWRSDGDRKWTRADDKIILQISFVGYTTTRREKKTKQFPLHER